MTNKGPSNGGVSEETETAGLEEGSSGELLNSNGNSERLCGQGRGTLL
jgi:hypothetical protein